MKKMPLKIMTPDAVVLSEECDFIVLPGARGEIGVLAGHAHLVAQLLTGTIRITQENQTKSYTVAPGFAAVSPSGVNVFTAALKPA